MQLAARERRLEHVARIHRAFGRARADDGVDLVDEHDQAVRVLGDLVDHALQAFLELAPVLRAGDHPRHVERHQALAGERLGHVLVDYPLGDALHDRGLADAGVAEQHRVVLRAAREDLDRLLDLIGPADHGIELPLPGLLREIAAVLVERLRRARWSAPRFAALDSADDRAAELRVRDREPIEQLARLGLGVLRQGQQHMLWPDVRRADLARLLVGGQECGLRVRRQRRRNVRALLDVCFLLDLRRNRGGVGTDLLQHVPDDLVVRRGPEQVCRVDVQAAPFHRLLRSLLEQLAGGVAEVLRDVDLLRRAARAGGGRATDGVGRAGAKAAVAEEVGEELVEEAPATERRPPYAATLTLKLPKVLFADGDRPLLTVLPDPHGCDGGPTPVDLAHRGRHQSSSQRALRRARGWCTEAPA